MGLAQNSPPCEGYFSFYHTVVSFGGLLGVLPSAMISIRVLNAIAGIERTKLGFSYALATNICTSMFLAVDSDASKKMA